MKEVMGQYGKAVSSALLALLLFSILFTGIEFGEEKGLTAILGERYKIRGVDYSSYKDGKQSEIAMERKLPEIRFVGEGVTAGKEYVLEDLFQAEDEKGNPAKVHMIKALDMAGRELEITGRGITFSRQGVYRILVKAIDSYCAEAQHEFLVPVGRR